MNLILFSLWKETLIFITVKEAWRDASMLGHKQSHRENKLSIMDIFYLNPQIYLSMPWKLVRHTFCHLTRPTVFLAFDS